MQIKNKIKLLAESLDSDYTHTSLVDLDTVYWKSVGEITDVLLEEYIEKRFNSTEKVVIKKYRINNGFAIIYFFYQHELEQYLERENEENFRLATQ